MPGARIISEFSAFKLSKIGVYRQTQPRSSQGSAAPAAEGPRIPEL